MEPSHYRISLDVHSAASAVTLSCKQGDTGRRILAALTDDGVMYTIGADCRAVFTARKPDGNILYNDCRIEGNRVCYDLTPQTTAVPGLLLCELRLYGAGEQLLTSPRFFLHVDRTVYTDGDVIESTDEVTTLTGLVAQIREKLDNGEFKGDTFTYEDLTPEQLEDLRASIYGYYIPSVDQDGTLTWQPTGETMPAVPAANIRGPAPVKGQDYYTEAEKAQFRAEVLAGVTSASLVSGYYTVTDTETLDSVIEANWELTADAGMRHFHVNITTTADLGAAGVFHVTLYRNTSACGRAVASAICGGISWVFRRMRNGGVWEAWECGNPPMAAGVEYRTTERYLGSPVYAKLIDAGILPNSTFKEFALREAAGGKIVGASVITYGTESDGCNYSVVETSNVKITCNNDTGQLFLTYNIDNPDNFCAYILIKYCKA